MHFNKSKIRGAFTLLGIMILVAIVALLALFPMPAQAQLANVTGSVQTGQPNFFYNDTNYTSFALTNNQTQTYTAGGTNTYIKTIRQGQGLSLFLALWCTNGIASTTTNYTVSLDLTGDGTTWTAGNGARPFTWTVSMAGQVPGTNVFWTNIPATSLSNVRKVQVTKVSTTASNNIYGALGYSQSTQ